MALLSLSYSNAWKITSEMVKGNDCIFPKFLIVENHYLIKNYCSKKNVTNFEAHWRIFWFPGDEMFSDSYKMKLIDDVLYEVYGKVRKRNVTNQ